MPKDKSFLPVFPLKFRLCLTTEPAIVSFNKH